MDRRLGGSQSRSGHGGEEKNSYPLPGLEHPIIQPVAQSYTNEISWLHHHHHHHQLTLKFWAFLVRRIKIVSSTILLDLLPFGLY
jgi:hypothetical protein